VKKKAIIGIGLGVVLLTSIVGVMSASLPTDTDRIKDIERERELKLNVIDNASVAWQQGVIGNGQFIEVIDQSISDTDALREEYLSLNLPSAYSKYKQLSIDSLDKQKEAFLKLKEYVQTEDPELQQSLRTEFDQLLVTSFEYRRDALRELN
jgi:hypothetical protein